jgi:hypothetical protein
VQQVQAVLHRNAAVSLQRRRFWDGGLFGNGVEATLLMALHLANNLAH